VDLDIGFRSCYFGCLLLTDFIFGAASGEKMTGIYFNAFAPGLVEHEGQNAPKALTGLQLQVRSINRSQTPADLMGTLLFLCSSDRDVMTRPAIVEDGGECVSVKLELLFNVNTHLACHEDLSKSQDPGSASTIGLSRRFERIVLS